MAAVSSTSRDTSRQRVTTVSGLKLERQYLYLEPHIWRMLESLMRMGKHDSIGLAVTELILARNAKLLLEEKENAGSSK